MLCKRLALPAHDAGVKEIPTKQQLHEIEENIKYMETQLVGIQYIGFESTCSFCIGNSMVSSAIWKKHARVSFSKTIEIARVRIQALVFGSDRIGQLYLCLGSDSGQDVS